MGKTFTKGDHHNFQVNLNHKTIKTDSLYTSLGIIKQQNLEEKLKDEKSK